MGRPKDADSAVTRQRVLDAARGVFADLGYGAATNKLLAARAGVTTGALYHYFESKLDLYVAAFEDASAISFERFRDARQGVDTFIGQVEAMLEASHQLNDEDPSLARFLSSARIDRRRYPEVDDRLRDLARSEQRFMDDMVDLGVRTGEIDHDDRRVVLAFVRTVLIGLTDDLISGHQREHRRAIDALERLLEGKLVHPPA